MAATDRLYRSVVAATRFFSRGWGPVHTYESLLRIKPQLQTQSQWSDMLTNHYHPVTVKKVRKLPHGDVYNGQFVSPLTTLLPDLLPSEAQTARFEMLLPRTWHTQARPMFIHLAGTGDHKFWRRRIMTANPLLEAGIGAILLENPFYGSRKPAEQVRSQLHYVSDLFVMGLALILECLLILRWLEGEGLGPVGLTGISMGGHNASLAASVWPKPVAVVPCLSWSTASCVFTEGILSRAVCWKVLEEQLFYSKIGYDEERKNIFERVREYHHKQDQSSQVVGDQNAAKSAAITYLSGDNSNTSWFKLILPGSREKSKGSLYPEAVHFMRTVLDVATHLSHFPVPFSPQLATFLEAQDDLYVPRQSVTDVRSIWPGCSVNYISGGHVSAIVLQQPHYRNTLVNVMEQVLQQTGTNYGHRNITS